MARESDLLVTSLYMPGRDGREISAQIRRVDPSLSILAISRGINKRLMLKTAETSAPRNRWRSLSPPTNSMVW
jgi:hypothetical protein